MASSPNPRYMEQDGRRVRFDHILNKQHVYHPGRYAGAGIAPFGVLFFAGLVRDLTEGLDGYRHGYDFHLYDSIEDVSSVAGEYRVGHAMYRANGRQGQGLHEADVAFWRQHMNPGEQLPTYLPALIVGVAGELAVAHGVLPFDQVDISSQRFIRDHFRPPPERVVGSALI
jgi:hypothetical protein